MNPAWWLAFATPLVVAVGAWRGGLWTVAGVALVFVVLPVLDERIGLDTRNPPEGAPRARLRDAPLAVWLPVQLVLTAWLCARVGAGFYSLGESLGLALSLGIMNGAGGITIAHELMHRRGRVARAAAELLMATVSYPHFCVEHVHGHHRHVATPRDPASARLGEGLFAFYRRCLPSSLRSAWRIERARAGRRRAPSWHDARVRQPVLLVALYAGVFGLSGSAGLGFFVLQGLCAVALLEAVNYLEHYGLARRELAAGRYERVRPAHSWNSSARLSNLYLFNLARHSDHHAAASRPFDALRHHDDAPQLPAGYATMVLLALVPPLFKRVMDPRVAAWRARVDERAAAA